MSVDGRDYNSIKLKPQERKAGKSMRECAAWSGVSFELERKNFSSILMITACNSMSFRSRCACVNDSPLCEGVCRRRVGSCSTGTHTHTSETLSRRSGRTFFFGSPFRVRRKQKKPEIYGERVISLRLYYSFSLVGGFNNCRV